MIEKVANLTISGTIGPGFSVTSLVIPNVTSIAFRIKDNVIDVEVLDKHRFFDYNATATVTYTISGNTATITVS